MIKAIIFDCFGVLVESSYKPFVAKYFAHDSELMDKFYELDQLSSKGKMDYTTLNKEFAKRASITEEQAVAELKSNPKNRQLLEYIRTQLGDYKIGMLSNVAEDRINEMFAPEDVELFDDIVLSFRVGMAKPDEDIFRLSAKNLGVKPEECVFVDDSERYLEGASSVGMKTVLFDTFENFKEKLELLV